MLYKYVKREIIRPAQGIAPKKRNIPSLLASITCVTFGIGLIFYTVFPYLPKTHSAENYKTKTVLTPSLNSEYATNIQTEYNSNVNRNISKTNQILKINPKTHSEYSSIQGEMKLTIPKLGLVDLPVLLNVDSFNEQAYLPLLEKQLAHFQGTSIPGKPGNTFVYGHSANELLAKYYPNHPKYAFSFLGNLDIGDEVLINYNARDFRYTMNKSKVVSSEDISPIYSTSEDQQLTLMTCWPPGIGNDRLIITANLLEEK